MGDCVSLKEDIQEIKTDIREIKADLSHHISRTAASEARLEVMEDLVKNQLDKNNDVIKMVFESSASNQKALNKQLMISIGIFGAIATLVTALAAWINAAGAIVP